jgi:hypothetical protein
VFKNIVSNFSYPHIKPWIDWKNLFHFVMYEQYAGNIDHQDYHNWQAVGPLKPFPWQGKNGGFYFIILIKYN